MATLVHPPPEDAVMTPRLDRWGDPIEDDDTRVFLPPKEQPDPARCAICHVGHCDPGRGICPECDARTRRP